MFAAHGLGKSFGGAEALRGVDLVVEPGEVHALLGPNGAGKSTLIKCLGGAVAPDRGSITLGDTTYASLTPKKAREAGVAVIYQHFSLIPTLSVADNIFLGEELRRGILVRRKEQETQAGELCAQFEQRIDPSMRLGELPIASQQLVEIAKALRRLPRLLILDEPTASLTEVEARLLGQQLRSLKKRGLPILYVTHLLEEVFDVADRVTVLRDGAVALSDSVSNVSRDDLVEAIAGRQLAGAEPRGSRRSSFGEQNLLSLTCLQALGIGPLDLHVAKGEVVAVFGLLGSGRTELLETIFGVRPREGGDMAIEGASVTFDGPHEAIENGVALVPGERLKLSLFLSLSNLDNMMLPSFRQLSTRGVRQFGAEKNVFQRVAAFLQLRPPSHSLRVGQLSGGNQQKVAVGRWLATAQTKGKVRVLMLDEPTQGIDVGARSDLYRILREFAAEGDRGVIMTSSDPEEVIAVADRAYVLHRGRLVAELDGPNLTERRLLAMAHARERVAP